MKQLNPAEQLIISKQFSTLLGAGLPIGRSLAEPDLVGEAKAIMDIMAKRGASVPIPA